MLSIATRHGLAALLLLTSGSVAAMEAMSEDELGAVTGAGVGFFVDNFLYDQGTATAQIGGLKDSSGGAVTIDVTRGYIKGEGSRRGQDDAVMAAHDIGGIDLVVVNLYPFEATVARGASWQDTVENIDVGGPAMIRAAAKNHASVTVVVDPQDYRRVGDELAAQRFHHQRCPARAAIKAIVEQAQHRIGAMQRIPSPTCAQPIAQGFLRGQ